MPAAEAGVRTLAAIRIDLPHSGTGARAPVIVNGQFGVQTQTGTHVGAAAFEIDGESDVVYGFEHTASVFAKSAA